MIVSLLVNRWQDRRRLYPASKRDRPVFLSVGKDGLEDKDKDEIERSDKAVDECLENQLRSRYCTYTLHRDCEVKPSTLSRNSRAVFVVRIVQIASFLSFHGHNDDTVFQAFMVKPVRRCQTG